MKREPLTKSRLLQHAMELFADRGYESTTMKEIAASVGIKAASIYAHYRGKEEVFRDVLEDSVETWTALVDGIFDRAGAYPDLEEGLTQLLAEFAGAMAGSVAYRFWARVYVFPCAPLRPADRKRLVEMDRRFVRGLKKFCATRVAKPASGEQVSLLCSSLAYFVMGLMTYSELMNEKTMRKEIRRGVSFHVRAFTMA